MKVIQFMVNGFEDVEAIAVIDLLRRASIEVDTVSMNVTNEVVSSKGIRIICDYTFNQIDPNDYQVFLLPGGPGVDEYYKHPKLLQLISKKASEHYLIGAICAAPKVLASLDLLNQKRATAFPSVKEEIILGNAQYVDEAVVVDGHIITSKSMGTAIDYGLKLIELIDSKEKSEFIRNQIYY